MNEPTFSELRRAMFRHYGEARYREALAAAREAEERFPDQETRTAYWVACLLCRDGNADEAVRVLETARNHGHWWGEGLLKKDPDLEPLWGRPEFVRLAEGCREAHRAAQAAAKPRVFILCPDVPLSPSSHPLLLSLHGRSGNAEEDAPYFQSATARGWIVALAQGIQLEGEGMYTWDDPTQAKEDVAWAYGEVLRSHPVDPNRIILAGISQGGALALALTLQGKLLPACGFVAIIPSATLIEEALDHACEAARRGVRGWIASGEKDPRCTRVRDLHAKLVRAGLVCHLEVFPNLGHEIPEDFAAQLSQALEFVTNP